MLKQFSRLERTRNIFLIVFALLMGVSLIFFYAPSRNSATASPATSREVLARVGGDEVTVGDLTLRKDNIQQRFGGQINLAMLGGDRRFLDALIRERIVAQEAARLGLAPSDVEVADAIRKEFTDPSTGKFVGNERYKQAVTSQFGSVQRYEQEVRNQVAGEKLRAFITAGGRVSDEEAQLDYQRKNTTFDLVYVPVVADQLAKKINPSDEELQKYFDEHKNDFRINLPQKKIRYLYIDQVKAGAKLQVSDEELRKEFDGLAPENKEAGVRVQQIVLKVARPDLDEGVRAKADELVQRARSQGATVSEEAFADLARGNSEDPATAKGGGALTGLVRKNPNKPDDPLQSTLTMEPGQVSEPIKYNNAYYIFRRGDAVEKTFEEARRELEVSSRNRRAYSAAAAIAQRAAEQLKESKDLQAVAGALAAEANMSPGEMIRETPFVKPGDDVPDIGSSPQFEQAIEPLNNPGDVGDRVSIKNGFAIPMLVEKREPRVPELAEVRDQVLERFRQERATAQLEQTARELASTSNGAGELKAAAEKFGLKAETADAYKLETPLGQAGTSPAADEAIYAMKAGEVTKTPIKIGDTWVVIGANKRTDADLAEFAKQRDQLIEQALTERRSQVYEDYLTAARARMEHEGDIKIYEDVLAKVAADEPSSAAAPFTPGAPPQSAPPGQ